VADPAGLKKKGNPGVPFGRVSLGLLEKKLKTTIPIWRDWSVSVDMAQ
jgi:hypothetical protein